MIKLTDGELLDLLPSAMKGDIDMVCLSYAIREVTQELLAALEHTRTQSFIEGLPEYILDVLAVETNAMYYDQDLPIETKREIIQASYSAWYARAGTPAAVEELVRAVFGEGTVVEWFDFTEGERTPGTFDILTSAPMTEDIIVQFETLVRRVKNKRSHIRRVISESSARASPRVAAFAASTMNLVIDNFGTEEWEAQAQFHSGAGIVSHTEIIIENCGAWELQTAARYHSGAESVSHAENIIEGG